MEPATAGIPPLTHVYNCFADFSLAKPNVPNEPYLHKILNYTIPAHVAVVQNIFNDCQMAKSKPWISGNSASKTLRQLCRSNNLLGHTHLISFVSLSALFAGQCKPSQYSSISEELISNALESTVRLPVNVFTRFPKELSELSTRSIISVLSTYSNFDQLETPQEGFLDIFGICRLGMGFMMDPKVKLQAFLQFPNACWQFLTPDECSKLKEWILLLKKDTNFCRRLEGFIHVPCELVTQDLNEWSERLVFMRQVGCLYMLGLHLNMWPQGIEKVFPGYIAQLCTGASAYALANKNVIPQIFFINRLIQCSDPAAEEYKTLIAIQSYFLCISGTEVLAEPSKSFPFLIYFPLIARHLSTRTLPQMELVAGNVVENLRKLGINTGTGPSNFLTAFFAHPYPEFYNLIFKLFGIDLLRALPDCPLALKENVAQALLAFIRDNPLDPHIPTFIDLFPTDIPCYPQLLCQKILSPHITPDHKANLLDEARRIHRGLRFEARNTQVQMMNFDALERLFEGEKKIVNPAKIRRKK